MQKKPAGKNCKRAGACCLLRGIVPCCFPAELATEIQGSELNDGEGMGKASVAEKEEGKHFKVVSS